MEQALRRLRNILSTEGWKGIWFRALSRTVYRRLVLVERALDKAPPSVSSQLNLKFGLLQAHELDDYYSLQPDAKPEVIRKRLTLEMKCFTARLNGRLVAVCWASTVAAHIDYLEQELQLAPEEVYIFDSYTSTECRGQNVAGARGAYIIRYFQNAGYKRLIGSFLPENKPAIRPLVKLGYHPFAITGRWKIGPWRHDFYKTWTSYRDWNT